MSDGLLRDYPHGRAFDEAIDRHGVPRGAYAEVLRWLESYGAREFERRRQLIDLVFRNQGITFTVYGDERGTERAFPFDPVPRLIDAATWTHLDAGLRQRVTALNHFLRDIYAEQAVLRDGVLPRALIERNPAYRPAMHGVAVPHGVYTHVVGTDLIRDEHGAFLVLEDNLRVPSGVSYMLANRAVMTRSFPRMMDATSVRPIRHYPVALLETLRSLSPRDIPDPTIVVLTPGPFNSAYFEHAYLAQQMGVELVEGRDLFVDEGRLWMTTTHGREQVDVVYRRIDDDYLDPDAFRPDSALGVRGLLEVARQGRVALANAPGTGIADDKAVYAFVPDLIRYYLSEEPLLPNVPTFRCGEPGVLEQVERDAETLVIKEVGGAGGYGMLIGPESTAATRAAYLERVRANPHGFIAQPVIPLSTHPTFDPESKTLQPRHVDLRPYVLVGERITIVPGGLTRVALRRGSLVVNSSQGGGSADTWVLDDGGGA
jgi:uncharacterized circularly permuted ATP-grasp superfamily protein